MEIISVLVSFLASDLGEVVEVDVNNQVMVACDISECVCGVQCRVSSSGRLTFGIVVLNMSCKPRNKIKCSRVQNYLAGRL